MSRFGQIGIALGALGIMIALMGLFPTITGVQETRGIGIVQIFLLLVGDGMLIFGAIIYAKFTFYLNIRSTLAQQIGIRLALTGLLFTALSGLSDILGFGSHIRTDTRDIYLGWLQMVGILASFAISSGGVLLYTVAGLSSLKDEPPDDTEIADKETV